MLLRVQVYLSSSLEIPQDSHHLVFHLDRRVDMNYTVGDFVHLEFLDIQKLPQRRLVQF